MYMYNSSKCTIPAFNKSNFDFFFLIKPQLVDLMGKDKFDQYAGKIWQLKFCNECFEQLPHLRS